MRRKFHNPFRRQIAISRSFVFPICTEHRTYLSQHSTSSEKERRTHDERLVLLKVVHGARDSKYHVTRNKLEGRGGHSMKKRGVNVGVDAWDWELDGAGASSFNQ
jgi:hypothetical protein